jgi:leucyl aminopeptidase (aminopeptidase T)
VEIKDSVIIRAWGNTPLEDSVAKKFYEDITAWGCENAIKMAHVSFGLLPGLREYADEIVMDERIWPIMVWGIGNIVPECVPPIGQPSNYHIDGMSLRNSVFLDGEAIMVEDEFIHPQLAPIVKRLFDSMA